ncbi:hypothetical protein FIBSPDRAFT_875475 [Athelia psychrophila]|uniref:Uncharacterized protein n=1 Tax=Athelia psychrophila TaxID=1759441 RepID=A0A167XQ36_9AGAM|nr:hypothetical protein FIBSPDRAFT_875475 [Fibularhizoctonia sp. CBS 109695]
MKQPTAPRVPFSSHRSRYRHHRFSLLGRHSRAIRTCLPLFRPGHPSENQFNHAEGLGESTASLPDVAHLSLIVVPSTPE